jgi:threonine/homoserine/homoserine lactone efflux protein
VGNKRILGLVLLVAGGVLLYFGWQATDAPLEQARESLTGDYSERTMQYLIGGALIAAAGVGLLLFGGKR